VAAWRERATIALLCAVMFTSGADLLIMTPILPQLVRELDVDVQRGSWWISIYSISTATFAIIFGPISDRLGRRPILIAGMTVLALGTLCCSRADDFTTMLISRAIAGIGAGMLVTSTTSYVGDHFEGGTRAVAMGCVMSGFFLSLFLALPIGAALTVAFGWNAMFAVIAGFAALVTVVMALFLPKPRSEQRTEHFSIGAAAAAYGSLLTSKKILGILTMSATIGMSMTMFSVYSSPWLEQTYGLETGSRGLVYAAGGPAVLLGGPIAGKLSNRFGRVFMILAGSFLMAMMQIAMPFSAIAADAVDARLVSSGLEFAHFGRVMWPVAVPSLFLFFMAMMAGSSRSAPFQTLALEICAPEKRGALSAIRNSFNQVGSGIGATLGGILWATASRPFLAVCIMAAAITLGGVLVLRVLVGNDRPIG
jgi:predicted MFS family arabinose efflux permease